MCHYSGPSFRAAVPRKKPLHSKGLGRKSWQTTHSLICCVSAQTIELWFVHPIQWSPSICFGSDWTSTWVNIFQALTRKLKGPSGRQGQMILTRILTTSLKREASLALIGLSTWNRGTLNRRGEEQIKQIYYHKAEKVRAWQRTSCWEEDCSGADLLQIQPGWLPQH